MYRELFITCAYTFKITFAYKQEMPSLNEIYFKLTVLVSTVDIDASRAS